MIMDMNVSCLWHSLVLEGSFLCPVFLPLSPVRHGTQTQALITATTKWLMLRFTIRGMHASQRRNCSFDL